MIRLGRVAAVALLLLGGAMVLPEGAAAHALLQSSDPAAGSTVASAPPIVTLTFGEAPDPALSSVKVLDASGRDVASGPSTGVDGHPEQLQVPLGALPEGVYTVAWRTVSTVDGHTVAGSFAFGVGVSPGSASDGSTGTAPVSASASPAATLMRFLLYAGLIVLLGVGLVGAVIHPAPPRTLALLGAVAWAVSCVGALGVVVVQALDAGADPGVFLSSSLGGGAVSRIAVAVASGVPVAGLLVRGERARRAWSAAIAVGAAAAMLTDVVNGHAAASGATIVQVGLQWIHVVAVGVWLGGVVALLLSVRGLPGPAKAVAARRFSRIAGFALAAVAVTGVVRAIEEVGSVDQLLATDFGQVVVVKSLLLVVIAALGAVNHFVSVPRAIRTLGPLRRVGRVEVIAGGVVVLLTAILVNLVPPSSVATASEPAPTPIVAAGSDFGTTVRVRLVVSPGTAGINDFAAAVTDYDTDEPVAAGSVSLRFKPASATGIGGSTLPLAATGPGTFDGSGANLSLDGIWGVTAVVAAPSATVEVPLPIATRVRDVQVDANAVPGAPTIFTAHLPAGTTLQVYLDPGTAGPNELHSTFFDAAGNELPVTTATYLVGPADGPTAIIAPASSSRGTSWLTSTRMPGPWAPTSRGRPPTAQPSTPTSTSPSHPEVRMHHRPRSLLARLAILVATVALVAACAPSGAEPASTAGATPPSAIPITSAGRPSSPAVVTIVQPQSGQTVTGSTVHVVLTLTGAEIVPATTTAIRPDQGHVHLYVDNVLVSMNYGLEQDLPVQPGTYVLKAEFVASDHAPFNPRVWSPEVFFTVN